jgi:ABC-type transport system involved in multi-copper enzyme maturation permease subunit
MFRYILRELDRALRSKAAYVYFAGIFVLCIIANIAVIAFRTVYGTNEGTYAYNIMEYAAWSFIVPYLSCIMIAHMVIGKEYPDPHIRDGATSGLNRVQIYLSKLISGVLLAGVFLVITYVALVVTTALFHFGDGTLTKTAIRAFTDKMVLALPLFLAGVCFGMMFLFIFKDKRKAYVGFYILTFAIPRLVILLAKDPPGIAVFKALKKYTISQCFTLIPYPSSPERSVPFIIGLGLAYSAISTAIGVYAYCKAERK